LTIGFVVAMGAYLFNFAKRNAEEDARRATVDK
jgi:hypothetical protein